MRNLEPNEYRSLVESYVAVYDQDLRNKLDEEKEVSEFYEFVESLLDDGYDLSEYTEEELYEYYITEAGGARGKAAKAAIRVLWGATREGIRKGLKIPPGQSTVKTVGEKGARAAGQAVGSTAKSIYDIGSGLVGTTLRTGRDILVGASKKRIIALPTVVGGVDYVRHGPESWTGKATRAVVRSAQGKFPQSTIAKPEPEKEKPKKSDPFSNVPSSLREESPDWSSIPGKPWATLTKGSERKIYVPGLGWQFPGTINKELVKRGKPPIKDPGQPPKPSSQTQPSKTPAELRAELETEFPTRPRQQQSAEPPKAPPAAPTAPSDSAKPTPASTAAPEPAKPTPEPPKAPPAAPTTPARAPQPTRTTPAPKPSLQTGDRNKDLKTWAQANKGMIQKVGTPQQKAILSAVEKGEPIPAARPLSVKESYDPFDLVLEYLFSQGHVDTLEEALYVMMEMSSNTIQNIVEGNFEIVDNN